MERLFQARSTDRILYFRRCLNLNQRIPILRLRKVIPITSVSVFIAARNSGLQVRIRRLAQRNAATRTAFRRCGSGEMRRRSFLNRRSAERQCKRRRGQEVIVSHGRVSQYGLWVESRNAPEKNRLRSVSDYTHRFLFRAKLCLSFSSKNVIMNQRTISTSKSIMCLQ